MSDQWKDEKCGNCRFACGWQKETVKLEQGNPQNNY